MPSSLSFILFIASPIQAGGVASSENPASIKQHIERIRTYSHIAFRLLSDSKAHTLSEISTPGSTISGFLVKSTSTPPKVFPTFTSS